MIKNCLHCGKEFSKSRYESVKSWTTRHKFCSHDCHNTFRKGKPSPSPETTFKVGHKTYSEFDSREKRTGKANNKWRGGVTSTNKKARKSKKYRIWRESVFKRDDFVCQACGQRGGELHAHHDLPFALFPDLRFEILNGMTLCIPCHRLTPTYGKLLKVIN